MIISSLKEHVIVTEKFKTDNVKPCIHADVGELLFTWEESKKENDAQANCKIDVNDEKKHICISFDGESHGLIWINKARGSKKGTCLKCSSLRCKHVQTWNCELKKEILPGKHLPVDNVKDDNQDKQTV